MWPASACIGVSEMRSLVQKIRETWHPLYYARKLSIGRWAVSFLDRPVWLRVHGVSFRVRGKLLTHGLGFAVIGSQEVSAEALAVACMQHLQLQSFWDVGANFGYYTWRMKTLDREIEAVLFEPLPANAALIQRTVKRNALPKTTVISAAASDRSGKAMLNADSIAGLTSSLEKQEHTFEERHWGAHHKQLSTPIVTIDEVRRNRGPVGFMKIDVEGHEEHVLRGARETIASDQPILLIECTHEAHSCLAPLEAAGYVVFDADHLGAGIDAGANSGAGVTNYLCIPPRFSSSIEAVTEIARQRYAHSDSGSVRAAATA